MDYDLTIGDRARKVALSPRAGSQDQYEFRDAANDSKGVLRVVNSGPARIVLSVEDRMYAVVPVSRSTSRVEFLLDGELIVARTTSRAADRAGGLARTAPKDTVASDVPAKVVKVFVKPGARVREGETVLVLDAMKMQIHVPAPQDGTVAETYVVEGEHVGQGTKLFRLRPPRPGDL